jgi:hypothetical protein
MRGAVCLSCNCLSTMPPLDVARITPEYTDDDAQRGQGRDGPAVCLGTYVRGCPSQRN